MTLTNDGRNGYVIKQNYMSPFRPYVRLFWHGEKDLPKPVEINLIENESLSIVDIIED